MSRFIIIFFCSLLTQQTQKSYYSLFPKREVLIRTNKKIVIVYFQYYNHFKSPIIINDVIASCGCVTIEYPKKVILMKERGHIQMKLNLRSIHGYFSKSIYLYVNNSKEPIILRATGYTNQ